MLKFGRDIKIDSRALQFLSLWLSGWAFDAGDVLSCNQDCNY